MFEQLTETIQDPVFWYSAAILIVGFFAGYISCLYMDKIKADKESHDLFINKKG